MIKHIEERKHVFGFDRNSDSVKTRGWHVVLIEVRILSLAGWGKKSLWRLKVFV
jgi:hypothetical protein